MKLQSNHITVSKQAKYVTYGHLSSKTKYFWFVLHGSHMICEQMIYKFNDFNPDTHFVVAPEGLSRQYLKGFSGDVVASWMTSRDRLIEIEDFSNYLTKLFQHFENKIPQNCNKIALGFSQGGTTLFRWLHHSNISFNYLIAYSCFIPEDIDLTKSKTSLNDMNLFYTYGTEDEFLNVQILKAIHSVIDENNLNINHLPYYGKHKIDKDQLQFIFSSYISKAY